MSTLTGIADSYAEAVMDIAAGSGAELQVVSDLRLIQESLTQGELPVMEWLCMPSISRSTKLRVLRHTFEGRVHALTLRLLTLMVRRGRMSVLPVLYNAVLRLQNRRNGVVPVEVKTARPVGDDQKVLFEEKIHRTFGPSSTISFTTQPDLLGGFQIISPERKIDHSLKSGLSQLKKRLLRQ